MPAQQQAVNVGGNIMTLQNFNPNLTIEEDSFAWRYMDFAKISDLISNNTIYFSRLDTFHDPIEGLPLSYRANLQTLHVLKCEMPDDEFAKLDKAANKINKQQIDKWQKGTYCSCWYLTEIENGNNKSTNHHESLAMWNFFNNGSGFVLKINFNSLLSLISDSLISLTDEELFDAKFGKVYYLNYGEYLKMLNSSDNDFMPSLIKHNSYRFENELRFLLLRDKVVDKTNDRTGIKVTLNQSLNYKDHQIEILAHPDMNETDFKFYRNKFQDLGLDLKVSSILTKNSVGRLFN
jgi:hypothetical protein